MKNGKITEEGFKLYNDLSKNEVGTIFTGAAAISDYDHYGEFKIFRIDKDEFIPEFKKLVDMVHKNGANFMMQINHIGIKAMNKEGPIYAPSSLPIDGQNRNSKEMTKEDIIRIENYFAEAALRAKKAGFDGVEIHAAHHYLIREFLSPLYKKRTDEYGGNDENRARFLIEIIKKVREKVGKEYIVGMKINTEDGDVNRITEEGFFKACLMAEEAGIDFIQLSGIKLLSIKNKGIIYKDIGVKLAEKFKIPIIVTGGVRSVDEMNEVLNNSKIQYFGLARPLMIENDLIKKWKEGKTKKAKCVSCNSCIVPNKDYATCIFNRKKPNIKMLEPAEFKTIQMGEYKISYIPDGKGYTILSLAYFGSTDDDWKKKKQYLN